MKFNTEKTTNEIISFIRDYYHKHNLLGAVIGLSGGKDSAVCLALMVKAIGKENVLGLWLPADSKESDYCDALELSKYFGVELKEFDLKLHYEQFIDEMKRENNVSDDVLEDVKINIKPRLRMMTLYSYAAMMSKIKKGGYLVVGTSNKSERFVGYFTKGGDSVFDIAPLADLYVDEVIQIGDYLNVPHYITHKTPDDGLSGLSDEEKLGFTYQDVKKVSMEYESNIYDAKLSSDTREKVMQKHYNNMHKFIPVMYIKNKQKLGIYMGSFNPVHKGHIKVINYLLKKKYVDKILLVPTLNYWDKQDLIDINDRINMLKFYESDKIKIDTKNNKYIYTIDLIKKMEEEYFDYDLSIIMGADNIINFNKWKNYQELLKYHIIVMNRNGVNIDNCLKKLKGNFTVINDYLPVYISSTEIRNNLSCKYLDKDVLDYIKKYHLYGEKDEVK